MERRHRRTRRYQRTRQRDHQAALRAGGLAVGAGCLVLMVVLIASGLVITHPLSHSVGRWDEQVNALFARHRTSIGNRVTGDFTVLANTVSILVVAAVVSVIAVVRRRARWAVLLVIGLVVELALFLAVNYVVARPRPRVPHLGSTPSTFSWPSGHVAATFVLYGGIALVVMMVTRRLLPRILSWTAAAVLTTVVGLSRVYRGDHHPTDVMAGLALGVGALCVALLALRVWAARVEPTAPDRADTPGPRETADQVAGVA
jgi:undecaprenyl-diphosphatase